MLGLVVPALVVAGLYDSAPSFPVTVTIEDPDGCGGAVTPVGRQTVKKGDDLINYCEAGRLWVVEGACPGSFGS